jgi:hypothetical protein
VAVTILLTNGEGDHNFSVVPTAPVVTVPSTTTDDEDQYDRRRNLEADHGRRDFSGLLNSKAMNDPVRNDLPLLVVSMWQVTAQDNQTVKGGSG